ncbi:DUF1223 domain-containing protein [Bosea beijingensis]|uniref:DUF1223 domain-containing protein n=1 Tax=Bosea beijingensis TaxID=3068632 RepID=UPI0027416377|nr:DUF1223 domain-containing protein [Bosea sp. REN20]
MVRRTLLATCLALTAYAATPWQAAVAGEFKKPRAVIELFSSQGCAASPPANDNLAALSNDPELIVLSLNVDYWNYLGWKDSLAKPAFAKRQKAYGAARGDRQIYTPQAVINGRVQVLGNHERKLLDALAKAKKDPDALSLPVELTDMGDRIGITLSRYEVGTTDRPAQIWAFWTRHEVSVRIEAGENAGKTVTYRNAVRGFEKLGDVQPERADPLSVQKSSAPPDADGLVIIVQAATKDGPGVIYGAAKLNLNGER